MMSAHHASYRRIAGCAAALILMLIIGAGCHSKKDASPENFIAGLNSYFAGHPDCLFTDPPRFPYETTDPEKIKQMDALTGVQLLAVERAPELHESRYTLTAAGARVAPRFCFGHRIVTRIDSSTPPTGGKKLPRTNVAYHYTMQDVPVWAKTEQMRSAFPQMALATSGTASGVATLTLTIGGWEDVD
jgi:hypothetical protein